MNRTPLDRIALFLVIIGAINWLMIGLFNYNVITALFGAASMISRSIYSLVGLAGLFSISLLFRDIEPAHENS